MDWQNEPGGAPRRHPNVVPEAIQEQLVAFRGKHPHWGRPRKLVHCLAQIHPQTRWPAPSTVGEILKRHGLTVLRWRKRRIPPHPWPLQEGRQPNDLWTADFKGWFRTLNGTRVDPLTILDMVSRYLLRCQALIHPNTLAAQAVFTAAFQEFGLPRVIRTDNGPPFASVGLCGLSRLSVWWVCLGIIPERIRPGHPEENGSHERLHRTLKQAAAQPPKANHRAQQRAFDRFRTEYNQERPHEALAMQTLSQLHQYSLRPFPERLPEVEYTPDYKIRRVRSNGEIKWQGEKHYLSESLIGQWRVDFGPIQLAVYEEKTGKMEPIGC